MGLIKTFKNSFEESAKLKKNYKIFSTFLGISAVFFGGAIMCKMLYVYLDLLQIDMDGPPNKDFFYWMILSFLSMPIVMFLGAAIWISIVMFIYSFFSPVTVREGILLGFLLKHPKHWLKDKSEQKT